MKFECDFVKDIYSVIFLLITMLLLGYSCGAIDERNKWQKELISKNLGYWDVNKDNGNKFFSFNKANN